MRKLWTIFTVALVAFAAVACDDNKIDDENKVPDTAAKVSFTATIGDITRTYLEQDDELFHAKWVGDEVLCVEAADDKNSFGETKYYFSNTKSKPNTFTCNAEGVGAVVGTRVKITYAKDIASGTAAVDSSAGTYGMVLSTTTTLAADAEVKLSAECAVLLYSSAAEVTFTADGNLFCEAGTPKKSITAKAGNSMFVAITATADAATAYQLSYTVKGIESEPMTLSPAYGKIYDLGALTSEEAAPENPTPDEPTTASTIYFVPNSGWMADDAWFVAYFWNDASNSAVTLADADANGIYECAVPEGMSNVLFCRMNPAYPNFGWNSDTEADHVWNQTKDTTVGVAPANYFYITGWDTGEWNEAGYVVPETPGGATGTSSYALAGTFSGWENVGMDNVDGLCVARDIAMEAYAEFKIKAASSWDENYGGGIAYLNPNSHMAVVSGGGNIAITEAGVYDVYFDLANLKLYVVTAGADYTTAPLQSTNGAAPVITDGVVIYLNAGGSSLWDQSDSYFEAWAWATGGSGKWYTMTKTEEGIYQTIIPVGIDNIIFVRRAPTHSAGSWDDSQRWNKTDDLAIPAGYNLYTITGWGGSDGTWSIK